MPRTSLSPRPLEKPETILLFQDKELPWHKADCTLVEGNMAVQQEARGEPTQPYNVGKEKRHISAHIRA